jgi:hypothetical protein
VKDPEILDLMPDSSPENKSVDCCRGGLLDAWAINPSQSFSSFQIKVGNLQQNSFGRAPLNLTLMAPGLGYTCGPLLDVDPTVSLDIGGRRQVQVFSKHFNQKDISSDTHNHIYMVHSVSGMLCCQTNNPYHILKQVYLINSFILVITQITIY